MLVEAFPAAQLQSWNLPFQGYNGPNGANVRQEIVRALKQRVDFCEFREAAERSADALDAVVASFAAIAAYRGDVRSSADNRTIVAREGWIAVHP
ncbi:MAG: DUF429 domain-containing protein [Alphaproteobacteria bacterium]|nr:DUF429 domain-containing protein [Alphaproteobacteria bacterium]